MVIKTSQNDMFELIKNTKEAFKLEVFEAKFLPEYFDSYDYIVGDLSNNLLRLKGFKFDFDIKKTLANIEKYFNDSCALKCPGFILKKILTEEEFIKLQKNPRKVDTFVEQNLVLQKENFDKDSIVLISTPATKPNIIIDAKKMNEIPKGTLPSFLVEVKKEETEKFAKNSKNKNGNVNKNRNKNNKETNNNKVTQTNNANHNNINNSKNQNKNNKNSKNNKNRNKKFNKGNE